MTRLFSMISGMAITMIVAASGASSATLDGASFRVDYLKPDTSTIFSGPVFGVAGVGNPDATIVFDNDTTIMFEFSPLGLEMLIETTLVDPVFDADPFNGIRVTFINLPYVISSFDLFGNSVDVTHSFTAKELFINWSGSPYGTIDGDTLSFDIGLAPVPLPAALPMLLVGLGAMGMIGLRRTRKTSV